jgi:hypothetical protein
MKRWQHFRIRLNDRRIVNRMRVDWFEITTTGERSKVETEKNRLIRQLRKERDNNKKRSVLISAS